MIFVLSFNVINVGSCLYCVIIATAHDLMCLEGSGKKKKKSSFKNTFQKHFRKSSFNECWQWFAIIRHYKQERTGTTLQMDIVGHL